jgi:hypothetical protein
MNTYGEYYVLEVEIKNEGFEGNIYTSFEVPPQERKYYNSSSIDRVISWEYEDESQCCESYGTVLSNKSIDENHLYGSELIQEDLKVCFDTPPEILDTFPGRELPEQCDVYKFIVKSTKGKYIRYFYNCHNGYYTHNLTIRVNGQDTMNVAL